MCTPSEGPYAEWIVLYLCMLVDKELAVTLDSGTGNGGPRGQASGKGNDARDSPVQLFFFPPKTIKLSVLHCPSTSPAAHQVSFSGF